jgi:hypothetical protein
MVTHFEQNTSRHSYVAKMASKQVATTMNQTFETTSKICRRERNAFIFDYMTNNTTTSKICCAYWSKWIMISYRFEKRSLWEIPYEHGQAINNKCKQCAKLASAVLN